MQKPKEKKPTRIDWVSHIERLRSLGLTRSEYAKLHGLNYNQLNYWHKKLELINHKPSEPTYSDNASGNSFIELVTPQLPETASRLSITTPDGLKVELDQTWTPQDTVSFLKLWSQK